jgi:hypothetical protein
MKKSLGILSILLFASFTAHAGFTGVVRCWVPGEFAKQETVLLRMENGKLAQWSEKTVAHPSAKSLFGLLSEPVEEGAIESVRFGRGKNGYAMVSVYTTAESLTVGVSPDLTTGFYKYQDNGSGNGNQTFALKCQGLTTK